MKNQPSFTGSHTQHFIKSRILKDRRKFRRKIQQQFDLIQGILGLPQSRVVHKAW